MSASRWQCEIFKSLWYRVYFDTPRVKKGMVVNHTRCRLLFALWNCTSIQFGESACIICCKWSLPSKWSSYPCDGEVEKYWILNSSFFSSFFSLFFFSFFFFVDITICYRLLSRLSLSLPYLPLCLSAWRHIRFVEQISMGSRRLFDSRVWARTRAIIFSLESRRIMKSRVPRGERFQSAAFFR